ncbi:uncharacterized protein LOC141902122 [Tubulanus polymorphus]|uniref:uncharacterized protein LOC141902122 n=1 Tax=Tubulanus polymorphus TaxID=672921 RepID=UPI003DA4EBEC
MRDLNRDVLSKLQQYLHEVNSYVQSFKCALELSSNTDEDIRIVLHADQKLKPSYEHCRSYNLPMASEVSALLSGDIYESADIVIQCHEGSMRRISNHHRSYDPLHYVLLLPFGTDGWQLGLKTTENKTLTALDYYSYRLHVRKDDFNILMRGRRLFQQYAIDQWAKIKMARLHWAKIHQKTIRAEKDSGLHDALQNGDTVNPGKKIILPPTIYGSPRFYSEAFQNAMTIVRHIDNSFVVPYCPLLSPRYDAHINVEVVHSVQAVKYLPVQKYPPDEKLPCHLPNDQTVLFQADDAANVINRGPPTTKLTAFFQMNAEDATARSVLYPEFPRYFTWNTSGKKWQRRKRGTVNGYGHTTSDVLGRIPTISFSAHQTELYFLRLLLHHRPGPTSYEDLCTINGELCPTFQDGCLKLGLITDDDEINRAMEEASNLKLGSQLRNFFATLLIYCRPADPLQFWKKWKTEFSGDLMHQFDVREVTTTVENEVLLQLQGLQREGLDLSRDFSLLSPTSSSVRTSPRVIVEETSYDIPAMKTALRKIANIKR